MNQREDLNALMRGLRIAGPTVKTEADHFYTCAKCGQAVDMRNLGDVFHHEMAVHERIPTNDAALFEGGWSAAQRECDRRNAQHAREVQEGLS